jgi:hypothetical protein
MTDLRPQLPVAIPRPTTAVADDDPMARRSDDDPDAPPDWRIVGAVVTLLWAAFTSLLLSVAPPTSGSLAAWALATSIAGGVVLHQWLVGQRADRERAQLSSTPREALEDGAATGHMDGVEERLDEDPA